LTGNAPGISGEETKMGRRPAAVSTLSGSLLLNEVANPLFPRFFAVFGAIFGIRPALVPRKRNAQIPPSRILQILGRMQPVIQPVKTSVQGY
jgi:hypothetical protein